MSSNVMSIFVCTLMLGISCKPIESLQFENRTAAGALQSAHRFFRNLFIRHIAPYNYSVLVNKNFTQTRSKKYLINDMLQHVLNTEHITVPVVLYDYLDKQVGPKYQLEMYFVEHDADLKLHLRNNFSDLGMKRMQKRYLIVLLQELPKAQLYAKLQQLFAHFLANYIINVNIITLSKKRQVQIFTYYPYTAERCLDTRPKLLCGVNGGSTGCHIQQLFPDKINNLHGCPLVVVSWLTPPFFNFDRSSKKTSGFVAAILKVLEAKLNFTVRIKRNEPKNYIGGHVLENGTALGAYKILFERRGNLSIGCSSCTARRSTALAASIAYHQLQYVIVLRAAAQYTPYEMMLFPFSWSVWLIFLLFSIARLALLTFYPKSWLVSYVPAPLPRIGFALWLFTMFIMRSSYESSVFEFIHNAPEKPLPLTIQTLLDQNYRLITDQSTYRIAEYMPQIFAITSEAVEQPIQLFDVLLKSDGKVGALTSTAFLAHYLHKQRDAHSQFVIIDEHVMDNMICFYFTRYSYLEEAFSAQLSKMRSFGLFRLYAHDFDASFLPRSTAQSRLLYATAAPAKILVDFSFVRTAFICMLCLHGVAVLILGLEIMHSALAKRRQTTK